jgi:hypothetical protein
MWTHLKLGGIFGDICNGKPTCAHCMHACMHVCMHVCVRVCMYEWMDVWEDSPRDPGPCMNRIDAGRDHRVPPARPCRISKQATKTTTHTTQSVYAYIRIAHVQRHIQLHYIDPRRYRRGMGMSPGAKPVLNRTYLALGEARGDVM